MPSNSRSKRRKRINAAVDAEIRSTRFDGASGPRLADLSAEELWLVVDGLHDAVDGVRLDPRLRGLTRAVGEMSSVLGLRGRTGHRAPVQDVEPNSRRKIVARKAWT